MAPSQLAQLKAALNSAGLNRKATPKKSKKGGGKKGGAQDIDRAKKLAKLDDIRARFNKFDERETKHDVGGRNLKGVKGKPTAAKSAGIEQRRQTLLNEHNLRGHRGTFQDRRFGENDPTLSLEDRMLERYTRERQRGQGRKGLFNLDDDDIFGADEDGTALGSLTHGGRSVMDLPGDDFDAQGLGDDGDDYGDPGAIPWRQVARGHFGGFEDQTDMEEEEGDARKKTKQEVMSEIIAKSKEHKIERQKQKEMDDGLREELDGDLDELRELLGDSAPVPSKAQFPGPVRTASAIPDQSNDADYDKLVRSLVFDARAQPKDRTKTEDELALEEKERLEEAEAKRLRRMRGEELDEESEVHGRKRRRLNGQPDADDLGDDFLGQMDDDGNLLLGPGLDRTANENKREESEFGQGGNQSANDLSDSHGYEDDDDEDDDDEDGDEVEDEDEDEMSDLEDLDSDVTAGEVDDLVTKPVRPRSDRKTKLRVQELPFTFPCPATIQEFETILTPLDESAVPTVVQRIRALHHPSLAQGNKEKLQQFLGVLLDYVLILASTEMLSLGIISQLVPHLLALVKLNPLTAASHFITKLKLMQKNLERGITSGPNDPASKTLPGLPELIILRLVGGAWSTSDFSHPVVQPAMLLMGQYLGQSRIRGVGDVVSGLFLCSMVLQYETGSKRVMPEVINFLASALMALLKRHHLPKHRSYPNLIYHNVTITGGATSQRPLRLCEALAGDNNNEQVKSNLLSVTLQLVSSFSALYASSQAYVELFSPILNVLQSSRLDVLLPQLRGQLTTTTDQLARQVEFAVAGREPLALQDHKPVPIASYAPKFEDDFAPWKHYDPDVERNATAKLRSQYKKERKGAIRELRKDNRFLAGERAREQAEKDAAYNAKMRKAVGSLNIERAEEKEMEREKKRERRRAGK